MSDRRNAVGPIGFFIMGFSCVFGVSWLLLPPVWLAAGKSAANVSIGFLLGILLILLLSFSYRQAMEAVPGGAGEITYCRLAFGRRWAAIAGWCGFLVNAILCAWQTIAITDILSGLFPGISNRLILYRVGGHPVTVESLLIGFTIVGFSALVNLKGAKSSIHFQSLLTVVILLLLLLAVGVGIPHMDGAFLSYGAKGASAGDIISVVVILPFSIAGWENIAKGAGESDRAATPSKMAFAMAASIVSGGLLYLLLFVVQAALLPPDSFAQSKFPFVEGLYQATGRKEFGVMLLAAASVNSLNVYNGMFAGAARALSGLARQGYIPKVFGEKEADGGAPRNAVILVALWTAVAPFFGKAAFTPLVNVSALLYVLLWGSTVFSNWIIRKRSALGQSAKEKGQTLTGALAALFMLGGLLIPSSPGALRWPSEYLLAAGLIGLGFLLNYLSVRKNSK